MGIEQDRYGNYIDTGSTNLIRSSQIRARSTVKHELPVEQDEYNYNLPKEQDYEDYLFEAPTTTMRNRRRDMNRNTLYEEERRRGGPVSTYGDDQIRTSRAYPVSRYKMDVPRLTPREPEPEPHRMTRRQFTYAATAVGVASLCGGLFIKNKIDTINAREARGQFGFIRAYVQCGHHDSAINKTAIAAWMEHDYRVHFLQTSGDMSDSKEVETQPLTDKYNGSLDNVDLSFDIEILNNKYSVVLTLQSSPALMWRFVDNGRYFV